MSTPNSTAGLSPQEKRALLAELVRKKALRAKHHPVSFAQERLWFLQQLVPDSSLYHLPFAIRLEGRLDVGALEQSFREMSRRHAVLRTTFRAEEGSPVQVVQEAGKIPLTFDDLCGLPEEAREEEARRAVVEETQRPFDLQSAPPWRAKLLRLGEEEHVLAVVMHHIISDGWSTGVLARELSALYEAYAAGRPSPLTELPIQYTDYAAWQRQKFGGGRLEEQLAYWRRQLGGAPELLELPTDRPRPAVQTFRGASRPFALGETLSESLRELSRRHGVTLFTTLLAAFQALLARYTGQSDICVGTPVAGRGRLETEGLVGFFVNTLVLRARVEDDPTFAEMLARVREAVIEAQAYEDLPFEKIVEALQPARALSHSPLFQVAFAFSGGGSQASLSLPGLTVRDFGTRTVTAKFDLSLILAESGATLAGSLEYNTDLFDAATAEQMLGHFRALLEAAVAVPGRRLSDLPLLSGEESRRTLVEWNRAEALPAPALHAHELFEEHARRTPDATAAVFGDERITYGRLNARANQVARKLKSLGVGPETLVTILAERSIEMLVGLLGVLKAGGAYVPLNPEYPQDRLAFMLEDTAAPVLLTQHRLLDKLPRHDARVFCLDTQWDEFAAESEADPERGAEAGNLAYVIYTSGSTGRPKGVPITHANLSHHAQALLWYSPDPAERFLLLMPFAFDGSVLAIFRTLCTGGTLVIPSEEVQQDATRLVELIAGREVTHFICIPSLYELLLGQAAPGQLDSLRTVYVGAEACPKQLVEEHHRLLPRAELFNLYGPTEATIFCSAHRCEPGSERTQVPIGRPSPHAQLYILDARMNPVPVGVAGELHVGGVQLARGYHNRPALTAERFVPDPFSAEPGARLYKTGDLARHLPDGEIEFLGRADQQVKVRGFRIELGEVEGALKRHPSVRDAAAVVREDRPGDRRLVAYVAARGALAVGELREFLKESLPEYMVPSAFVTLEALPLDSNGKVDRKALPAPGGGEYDGEFVAARTPVEEILASIWASVLGLKRVGVADDFFERGGHSLLATQLMSRVREAFGVELPLRSLFERPTVAALAACVERELREGRGVRVPPLQRAPRNGDGVPLSFAQQRLWFLEQLERPGALYIVPVAVRLRGRLNVGALERALGEVVRRHEVLRTTFASEGGSPLQVVTPSRALSLPVNDLRGLAGAEREAEARRLAAEEAQRPFDLGAGPLLRAALLRLGEEEHVALLTMHHIICDGWSVGALIDELSALYGAFSQGQPSPLEEPPVQYADYAAWQRGWLEGEALERQLDYWRRHLAGAPVLELPTDYPRPPVQVFDGATHAFTVPREVGERLKEVSRREGATLFMTLLAAFGVALQRYSGQDDLVVGTDIANRTARETEKLLGCFLNHLALRTDLSGNPTFVELLARVREAALGAYAHQDAPFEKVVEAVQPERRPGLSPLFQVRFIFQNAPAGSRELPGLTLSAFDVPGTVAKFDLTLVMEERGGDLFGTVEYNTDLFEPSTVERMFAQFGTLLEDIAERPHEEIQKLSMISEEETRQLTCAFDDDLY
jgi:amino acid adenylation domain-containing protein